MGRTNTEEEIDRVIDVTPDIIAKLRAMSPLAKK
jgi:cysteine sulfinate desulfinase/cysteine desulfurase-like protein